MHGCLLCSHEVDRPRERVLGKDHESRVVTLGGYSNLRLGPMCEHDVREYEKEVKEPRGQFYLLHFDASVLE